MIKVWIAGSNGQIGRALNDILDPLEIEVLNTDLDDLDITNTEEVLNFGIVNRPDVIINCCGVTDTDLCEKEPGKCTWSKKLKYRRKKEWRKDRPAFNR